MTLHTVLTLPWLSLVLAFTLALFPDATLGSVLKESPSGIIPQTGIHVPLHRRTSRQGSVDLGLWVQAQKARVEAKYGIGQAHERRASGINMYV